MTLGELEALCDEGHKQLEEGNLEVARDKFQRSLKLNPKHCLSLIGIGWVLMHQKNYQEAINIFDKVIEIEPDNENAWLGKGHCLKQSQSSQKSLFAFEQVLKVNPNSEYAENEVVSLLSNQGLQDLQEGNLEIAHEKFQQALKLNPKHCLSLVGIGWVLMHQKNYQEAINIFDKVIEIEPDNENAWLGKGYVYKDLQYSQEALLAFEKVLNVNPNSEYAKNEVVILLHSKGLKEQQEKGIPAAKGTFQRIIQLQPNHLESLVYFCTLFIDEEKYEESLKYFDKIIAIVPKNSEVHYYIGFVLASLKRLQDAIESYDRAIEISPTAKAFCGKGVALNNTKNYHEAIECAESAIAIDPELAHAWYVKGFALRHLKQYEEALSCYNRALEMKSSNAYHCWVDKGYILFNIERYKEAVICCNKALAIESELSLTIEAKSDNRFHRGQAFLMLKEYEKAISSYDEAIKVMPANHLAWYRLAIALVSLGRYENSIPKFNQAIKLKPDFYEALTDRGIVISTLGRVEEGLEDLKQAIQINSDYDLAWSNQASLLRATGKFEDAITSYERALELNPNYCLSWHYKGVCLFELNRYSEALKSFDRLLKTESNLIITQLWQGITLTRIGRYEEALESFDNALQREPVVNEQTRTWIVKLTKLKNTEDENKNITTVHSPEHLAEIYLDAYLCKADILEILENYQQAVESCTKALEIKSDLWEILLKRGFILLQYLNNYEKALADFDKVLTFKHDCYLASVGRGSALSNLKFHQESVLAYDKAIEIDEVKCQAWIEKGKTIWKHQGYQEALEILNKGLAKQQEKSPSYAVSCGCIHSEKGFIYYQESRQRQEYFYLLEKAQSCYEQALKAYDNSSQDQEYLKCLQMLINILVGLGKTEQADELIRQGTDRLKLLLDETPSKEKQKILSLKFASFNQLTVDRCVRKKELSTAIETAEKGKNACLTWLLSGWSEEITSPNYQQMQQLLNQKTAIIYWHLSPVALTTFVLKHGEPEPIVINNSKSLQTLVKFETWKQEWDKQYQDYRNQGKKESKPDHSWRKDMQSRLDSLKDILHIEKIEAKLTGISQIILIPHRDLHRFPLHSLFDINFVPTYLPSIQMGINLQSRKPANNSYLLSVENPASDRSPTLGFARLESQLISQLFHNTQYIQEKDVTKNNLTASIPQGYNALHFCGHAIHHPDNPQQSELLLAGKDNLQLGEMYQNYDLSNYNLVSLSACETAITNNQSVTAEYVGLVSGFLSCGVAQVVSTLWTVESAASALVMVEFYRHRHESKSDAQTLQAAVNWLRQLTPETLQQWCNQCLEELPPELPTERRGKIKRTLYNLKAQYANIEEQAKEPYTWAAFTYSGNFS